jgi:hypothetical protein
MRRRKLRLSVREGRFAVARLPREEPLPAWAVEGRFVSITRTEDELSVVCTEERVPREVKAERGWRLLKVEGPFDFSQTGVLASLAEPLAGASISIFVLCTYDTDHLFVKDRDLEAATAALRASGHAVAP